MSIVTNQLTSSKEAYRLAVRLDQAVAEILTKAHELEQYEFRQVSEVSKEGLSDPPF